MLTILDLTRLLPCRFEVAVQVAMAWADMAVTEWVEDMAVMEWVEDTVSNRHLSRVCNNVDFS
jgi:hypothetical protein